ncbi:MAG: phosphatidate cytidylyltransferase [Bacteroidia bacterium]
MALNFKTLSVRALSALVFVLLLMGCVYWNYISFTLFFFVVSLMGLNEFYKIAEKIGAKPFKGLGFILAVIVYLSFIPLYSFLPAPSNTLDMFELEFTTIDKLQKLTLMLVILGPFLVLTKALFSKKENSIQNAFYTVGGIIYAVVPFALLNQTVYYSTDYSIRAFFEPKLILGIMFLIWSNDTFAYLGGSLFGKNKMIERVSPGKTWEGTIIGVLITFGLSFTFNYWVFNFEDFTWPLLGAMVPVLATIGDLIESKLKREAGVKDSGSIMPGHGGILDRFDSLIFVSPFVFMFFKLF